MMQAWYPSLTMLFELSQYTFSASVRFFSRDNLFNRSESWRAFSDGRSLLFLLFLLAGGRLCRFLHNFSGSCILLCCRYSWSLLVICPFTEYTKIKSCVQSFLLGRSYPEFLGAQRRKSLVAWVKFASYVHIKRQMCTSREACPSQVEFYLKPYTP